MDQSENSAPENDKPESKASEAASKASDAAQRIKEEAAKTLRDLRTEGGLMGFLSFDKLYFPAFARILFSIACGLIAVSCLFGIGGSFVSMAKVSFFSGLWALFGVLIGTIVILVMVRIWIELTLVVFKMNEGIQDIRDMLRKKLQ